MNLVCKILGHFNTLIAVLNLLLGLLLLFNGSYGTALMNFCTAVFNVLCAYVCFSGVKEQ